jgi:hypothetical protein
VAVNRRPGDVPRGTIIDIEQPGVLEDELLGCSTVSLPKAARRPTQMWSEEVVGRARPVRAGLALGAPHQEITAYRRESFPS